MFRQGQAVYRRDAKGAAECGTVDSVIPGGYLVKWESEPFVQPHGEAEAGKTIFETVEEVFLEVARFIPAAIETVGDAIGGLFAGASNTNEGESNDDESESTTDEESNDAEPAEGGEQAVEDGAKPVRGRRGGA